MAIGRHTARERELQAVHGTGRIEGVLGRLRHALTHRFSGERRPRERASWEPRHGSSDVVEATRRPRDRREPGERRAFSPADERAVMAAQHERALRRVAAAAGEVCEDWERGLDVDEAISRLRSELQTAAEYEA
jgi:hypothetical protein